MTTEYDIMSGRSLQYITSRYNTSFSIVNPTIVLVRVISMYHFTYFSNYSTARNTKQLQGSNWYETIELVIHHEGLQTMANE